MFCMSVHSGENLLAFRGPKIWKLVYLEIRNSNLSTKFEGTYWALETDCLSLQNLPS